MKSFRARIVNRGQGLKPKSTKDKKGAKNNQPLLGEYHKGWSIAAILLQQITIKPPPKASKRVRKSKLLSTTILLLSLSFVAFLYLDSRTQTMDIPPPEFTTNAEDKAEAAKLVSQLKDSGHSKIEFKRVPQVKIAEGANKYVLISAQEPGAPSSQYFVTSKKGASYHRNAAEPFVKSLKKHGYQDIRITGGGRILLDTEAKKISVFGFSYSFGQGNHELSKQVIERDERYSDFTITTSNEGY